ncbi:50S ribosomal protein L29 [Candidatus Gracilibacteria bacterium]|nr:50S ribosomal protein L29 [Candidatus Gracilibacteria bacterium]
MLTKEELKKSTIKELQAELSKTVIEYTKLSIEVKNRLSKETSKLKGLRKYRARIKTFTHQLEFPNN